MTKEAHPYPEYTKALALAQRALDWALEEERHQRHAALFVQQFRPHGETSTIMVPLEERDNLAEADRIAKASPSDVDSLVIGCWGPHEFRRRRMHGLHLIVHFRDAENGFFFFQETRTRWFRRGTAVAGKLMSFGRGFPILGKRPPRPKINEETTGIWPNAVSRGDIAQAAELFATNPILRDYWEALRTVGWLSALPEEEHAALRARLMKAHANNPASIHEGLAVVEAIDVLMVDQDMEDEDGYNDGSVTFLANAYRVASGGTVRLEEIQSKFVDPDAEGEEPQDIDDVVVRISFQLRGRTARLEMDFGEPLEPVREAVNGILAEDGEPRRIYHIPAPDRHIGFAFIPPDVYAAATTRGILPADSNA
jgi:hypothetical protein